MRVLLRDTIIFSALDIRSMRDEERLPAPGEVRHQYIDDSSSNQEQLLDNISYYELAQAQLVPCTKCGRTFFPDRVPIHERNCQAKPVQQSAVSLSQSDDQEKEQQPPPPSSPSSNNVIHDQPHQKVKQEVDKNSRQQLKQLEENNKKNSQGQDQRQNQQQRKRGGKETLSSNKSISTSQPENKAVNKEQVQQKPKQQPQSQQLRQHPKGQKQENRIEEEKLEKNSLNEDKDQQQKQLKQQRNIHLQQRTELTISRYIPSTNVQKSPITHQNQNNKPPSEITAKSPAKQRQDVFSQKPKSDKLGQLRAVNTNFLSPLNLSHTMTFGSGNLQRPTTATLDQPTVLDLATCPDVAHVPSLNTSARTLNSSNISADGSKGTTVDLYRVDHGETGITTDISSKKNITSKAGLKREVQAKNAVNIKKRTSPIDTKKRIIVKEPAKTDILSQNQGKRQADDKEDKDKKKEGMSSHNHAVVARSGFKLNVKPSDRGGKVARVEVVIDEDPVERPGTRVISRHTSNLNMTGPGFSAIKNNNNNSSSNGSSSNKQQSRPNPTSKTSLSSSGSSGGSSQNDKKNISPRSSKSVGLGREPSVDEPIQTQVETTGIKHQEQVSGVEAQGRVGKRSVRGSGNQKHNSDSVGRKAVRESTVNQVKERDKKKTSEKRESPTTADTKSLSEEKTAGTTHPKSKGPVLCYICGRNFGSASITIHEPSCLEKWKQENNRLPKHLRRPLPVKPDLTNDEKLDPEKFNKLALESANKHLVACRGCGRTFAPHRLAVHENVCYKGARPEEDEAASRGEQGKPRTMVCYICGREFGSKSLPIHEPQCLEKWKRENSKLPKALRRREPTKPDVAAESSETQGITREQYNEVAYESAKAQLIPCSNCGRTFFPDRLEVHQRSCRPKGVDNTGNADSENEIDSKYPNRPSVSSQRGPSKRTIYCYICGREFGSKSIGIHEPQCMKKWKTENDKLPAELRRPMPVKPQIDDDGDEDAYREAMNAAYYESAQQQLVPCPTCGRTFFPESLSKHLRGCK